MMVLGKIGVVLAWHGDLAWLICAIGFPSISYHSYLGSLFSPDFLNASYPNHTIVNNWSLLLTLYGVIIICSIHCMSHFEALPLQYRTCL